MRGGSVIASSTLGGTASEGVTSQLSAGTYYIGVYPYSGNTNYNLAVSATGGDWFSQNSEQCRINQYSTFSGCGW
jgi:hypothetical protein